jgi:hypothetical protein
MAIVQKRKKLKSYADVISEGLLDKILAMVEKEGEKPFAHTSKGERISKTTALKTLRERSEEMKTGKLLTHEAVKKKFAKKGV